MLINSTYCKVSHGNSLNFPLFSDERILMKPVVLGRQNGVPKQYEGLLDTLFGLCESRHIGSIGYLTIDEQEVKAGETLREAGWHIDGEYQGEQLGWDTVSTWNYAVNESGYSTHIHGGAANGFLIASTTSHCEAFLGDVDVDGVDEKGGIDFDPFRQAAISNVLDPNTAYWVCNNCIHQSMPVEETIRRQFTRLNMPTIAA